MTLVLVSPFISCRLPHPCPPPSRQALEATWQSRSGFLPLPFGLSSDCSAVTCQDGSRPRRRRPENSPRNKAGRDS